MDHVKTTEFQFPADFLWGVSTSAYQIEGAVDAEGRKPSVWDTFSRIPGTTHNGDTGDVACDHYHRFADDVKLMADLGIKHYRFSIAWPRIMPDGRGAVNEKGVDFYRRLTDALLQHGITPHATLFHWDSPQALEDRYGSWRSREMAKDFADYGAATVARLGDRITNWYTMNEVMCFTYLGYAVGKRPPHAPGTTVATQREVRQAVHHALLAHGLGVQAIRAAAKPGCQVGLAVNFDAYVPVAETSADIAAAKRAFVAEERNGLFLVPVLTEGYSPAALDRWGADAPVIEPGDMKIIAQPLDRLGFNIYTGFYVRAADNAGGYEILELPDDYPKIGMPWLHFLPDALYWGVRLVSEALGQSKLPMVISENGCATEDEVDARGRVVDLTRIMFLRGYLRNAQRAVTDGYPLTGYFHWSLLDNFEWAFGYQKRFGLIHVDYASQRRIPKESAHWYAALIRNQRKNPS